MLKKIRERYTNENLHKRVKNDMAAIHFVIASFIIDIVLIVSGFVTTYVQKGEQNPIPYETLTKESFHKIFYTELTEMPEDLGHGYYAVYNDDAKVVLHFSGNVRRQVDRELAEFGHTTVHGNIQYVDSEHEDVSKKIENYPRLKAYQREERYICISCHSDDLFFETMERNPVGFIFGIVGLILFYAMVETFGSLNVFRHCRPACGSTKFTIEEINEQANAQGSVWYETYGIYLTPKTMIGTGKGMTVVEYSDIDSMGVKSAEHLKRAHGRRRSTYNTYRLIVRTKNGKKLTFSNSKSSLGGTAILRRCKEENPSLVIDEYDS